MAEVIRGVVQEVDLETVRDEPDPVVLKGITLAPKYGTRVRVRRHARRASADLERRRELPVA